MAGMDLEVGGHVWREARLSLSCIIESSSLKPVRTVLTWPSRLFLPDCKLLVLPATLPTGWLRAGLSEKLDCGAGGVYDLCPKLWAVRAFHTAALYRVRLDGKSAGLKEQVRPSAPEPFEVSLAWSAAPPEAQT